MSSSLISLATLALVAAPAVATSYSLQHSFDQSNFFQNFSFYSESDPTDGFVQYLDYDAASAAGLATVKSGNVYLGADHTNTYSTGGRPSTRVESNFEFNQGLLIADLAHMPGNACGVWPAFWTVGTNWPNNGEIDIIEGVSNQSVNAMTLHTENECSITSDDQTGTLTSSQCSETDGSTGCQFSGTEGSFGTDFNANGGGVYAMEWTSSGIKVWFFPRSEIPECITSGNPDPSTWGTPMANFQGSCDFDSDFQGQSIIFNTDFCGEWAGADFASSGCPMSNPSDATASCEAYVGANPSAFTEAYWEIVSVKVYQEGNSSPEPSSSPSTKSTSAISTPSPIIPISTASKTAPVSQTPTKSPFPFGYTSSSKLTSSSSAAVVAGAAGIIAAGMETAEIAATPSTTSCSSKSTITITSTIRPSSSAIASSRSIVPISSAPANPVNAVSASSSKLTTTTAIVTSHVDVCPSGYVTKVVTQTVTYCPAESSTVGVNPAFTTTSKLCTTGCGATPTTVVVVIPVETSTASSTAIRIASSRASSSAHIPTETLPTLAVSSSVAVAPARTGSTTKFVPSSIRVPAASSSATVSSDSNPSSSLPSVGSLTTTAVSPAYTGAANKMSSPLVGLVATAVAAFVFFI